MDARMYPANEPLPPRDRVAWLERRISSARYELRTMSLLRAMSGGREKLRAQLDGWQRELQELRS